LGRARIERRQHFAAQQDLALVRLVDSRHDLEQGRLTGAVLTAQRVDLARLEADRDVAQGERAAERLLDMARFVTRGLCCPVLSAEVGLEMAVRARPPGGEVHLEPAHGRTSGACG
jgi:hypothetical protein